MTRDDNDIIPTWDGSAATWEDFEIDVELCMDSTPAKDRGACGPRGVRRLTGCARTAMLGMTHQDRDQLRALDGATFLLNYLRTTIGGAPTVGVGKFMERYENSSMSRGTRASR